MRNYDETVERQRRRVQELNDSWRMGVLGTGRVVLSDRVSALPISKQVEIRSAVANYDQFSSDESWNDHGCGVVIVDNERFFWRINYALPEGVCHAPDPLCSSNTIRVLRIAFEGEDKSC